jgi:hypothetical protein
MNKVDFIPRPDAQFNIWQGVWFNSIEKNAETWGIPSDVVLTTSELKSKWETTYSVVENPVTRARWDISARYKAA